MISNGTAVPIVCKACGEKANFWLLKAAQPLLAQWLGTAPQTLAIATMRHRCGSVFEVTLGDLRVTPLRTAGYSINS